MPEADWQCPGCGANSFTEIGKNIIKCPYCHGTYLLPQRGDTHFHPTDARGPNIKYICPICGKKTTSRDSSQCPWCMRNGICNSHFADGVCRDCHPHYKKAARRSETEARRHRIREEDEYYMDMQGTYTVVNLVRRLAERRADQKGVMTGGVGIAAFVIGGLTVLFIALMVTYMVCQ